MPNLDIVWKVFHHTSFSKQYRFSKKQTGSNIDVAKNIDLEEFAKFLGNFLDSGQKPQYPAFTLL